MLLLRIASRLRIRLLRLGMVSRLLRVTGISGPFLFTRLKVMEGMISRRRRHRSVGKDRRLGIMGVRRVYRCYQGGTSLRICLRKVFRALELVVLQYGLVWLTSVVLSKPVEVTSMACHPLIPLMVDR